MNQIIPHFDAEEHFRRRCVFWNSHEDWFIQRDQVKLHRYAGSLQIVDITDAMKPGKKCDVFSFNWWPHDRPTKGLYRLFERHGYDMRALINELRLLPWQKRVSERTGEVFHDWKEFQQADLAANLPLDGFNERYDSEPIAGESASLFRSQQSAIRIWSPFVTVNPLPKRPAKWTVSHVVRALLSGQYSHLRCNGVYTDDYAYDAAVNFQQGEFGDDRNAAVAFARRILESPSGWWTHGGEHDQVSICCHHFDSNSFKFELMKRFNAAAAAAVANQTEPTDTVVHAEAIHSMKAEPDVEEIEDIGEVKLIETQHTKTRANIFVVQLAERLSRKEYERVLDIAKSFGGYYSSYRRDGAVPGFIFKQKSLANHFITKLSPEPTNIETIGATPEGAQAEPASEISASVPPPSNPVVVPQIAPMPGFTPLGIPAWRLRFRA
ncbi:MAG TPA: hypothetical protein VK742_01145 [Candidatus Sulfotelmatobacter sp.]|jgi:hypothetical protein|nr:hypothetical protein [Candidatus Sulfotelmatobacter sp.]